MEQYKLTEQDIRVLIGVASCELCNANGYPENLCKQISEVSAEIAVRVCRHLSGKERLPEDAILIAQSFDVLMTGGESL